MQNVDEDIVRVELKYQNGVGVSAYAIRFGDTGSFMHELVNHKHAENFLRYLYSCTKAHPKNHLTERNLACILTENEPRFEPVVQPHQQMSAYKKEFYPKENAHQLFCDDGYYASFVVTLPDGSAWSNLIHREDGQPYFDPSYLVGLRGSEEDVDRLFNHVRERKDSLCHSFEEESPTQTSYFVDRVVQTVMSCVIGGRVAFSISHRDQLDHNQGYHVHRLLYEPPEDARIVRGPMAERHKKWINA